MALTRKEIDTRRKAKCKKEGRCPACKERKLEEGRKRCRICLNKDAERQRLKRIEQQDIREYRKQNNLCYFCGGNIEDKSKKVCNACSTQRKADSAKANRNKYWKGQNNLIFKNS